MTEPNSPPIRCPCGFFGSPQTLGLCSKCFREREENRNQATADIVRPSPSSSGTDQSRVSLSASGALVIDTSNSFQQMTHQDAASARSASPGRTAGNTPSSGTQTCNVEPTPPAAATDDDAQSATADNIAEEQRGKKRKRSAEDNDDVEDRGPPKRERTSNKHCHECKCRLELAVREIGKCKCGAVFCLLHRLPEQHNCAFDHKEDGRREARAKMVPARKHVGTTLKRLDSDC